MKKLIISSLIAMFCASAGATTMCATDDTLAIVLDPIINGTANSFYTDLFEWSATFSYGTVWGIATCVDTSGAPNTAVEELRDSNGEIATGGERTGRYCWCQLSHPAKSRWVFRSASSSVADCGSFCADNCVFKKFRPAALFTTGAGPPPPVPPPICGLCLSHRHFRMPFYQLPSDPNRPARNAELPRTLRPQ